MKKFFKSLVAVASALAIFGFGFVGCSSGDDDDDDNGGTVQPSGGGDSSTVDATKALYRYGSSSDADFADGVLTSFDGTGTVSFYGENGGSASLKPYLLYYPTELDQESGSYVFQAKLNYSGTDGRVGIGLVGVKSSYVADGYAFLTAAQKIRYGKSYSLDSSCTNNGQGFDSSTGLTDSTLTAGTDYILRITAESGAVTFDVLDSTGSTVLATKASKFSTYFTTDDSVYFAIGAISGSTANVTYSEIKATVGGTEYSVNTVTNIPDLSSLSVSETSLEVNKDSTDTSITYSALDTDGKATTVTVVSNDESVATVSAADGTITINGIATGSTTITVTNASNTSLSETISVAVLSFNETDPTYSGISFYPANGATEAFEDGELKIAGFDSAPTLVSGGSIKIYDSDGNLADSIAFEDETQTVWSGVTLNVLDQLVRVTDNAVYVTPHIGALEYGKTYYVAISDGFIEGTIGGTSFEGLTNNASNTQWKFTVRSEPTVSTSITVNNSETASDQTFRSVQSALLAIGSNTGTYTVKIEPGTYYEDLYFAGTATVILSGDSTKDNSSSGDNGDVIISYTNATKVNSAEKTRNLLSVLSGNFVLENLKMVNTFDRSVYGTSDGQAEVIGFASTGTFAAYNCAFLSHQDTIRTTGKAWFYKCYIEGDTDYLWMENTGIVALYEECNIVSVYDSAASSSEAYITAPRMTIATSVGKGLVVYNSTVTVENGETSYLGRTPWTSGYYNQAAFINTALTGTGNVADWKNDSISDSIDDKYVGWKIYNVTNNSATVSTATYAGVITDADFISDEYSGRETILNRMIDVSDTTSPTLKKDEDNYWDVATLVTDMSWTVTKDTSSSGSGSSTYTATYSLAGVDLSTITDLTFNGCNKHDAGAAMSNSSITFDVLGACTVNVYVCYSATGTITAEGNSATLATSTSTNSTNSYDKISLDVSGPAAVSILTTEATYINKIEVAYTVAKDELPTLTTTATYTPSSSDTSKYSGLTVGSLTVNDNYFQGTSGTLKLTPTAKSLVDVYFCYQATGTIAAGSSSVSFSTTSKSTTPIECASLVVASGTETTITATATTYINKVVVRTISE